MSRCSELATMLFSLLCLTSSANAGVFDQLKDRLKSESEKAVKEALPKSSGRTARVEDSAQSALATLSLEGGPSETLTSMTSCTSLKPLNIVTGYLGEYTFQSGFSKETRSGLIQRKAGKLQGDCILPSLQSGQVAYMEVDTAAYEAMGNSSDWAMQCVRSENPEAGALSESEPRTEAVYSVSALSGKDMMLHCGSSEETSECAEGSNSARSSAWSEKLRENGKTMLSIRAFTSTLAPVGGEKLYCQYYNKKAKKSLFAFEYIRLRK
ncbi:hypothetical protein [uncultured Pseudoteredinibacter sp.]|uniref:hypothetical protein n=1 Tax=uncultured Pseudoteredinibacter sp. TaxID=1641701 RepID=UPI002638A8CF|nr:hypothetical protein [uncultured Pseudoteredinibacter sp.]